MVKKITYCLITLVLTACTIDWFGLVSPPSDTVEKRFDQSIREIAGQFQSQGAQLADAKRDARQATAMVDSHAGRIAQRPVPVRGFSAAAQWGPAAEPGGTGRGAGHARVL